MQSLNYETAGYLSGACEIQVFWVATMCRLVPSDLPKDWRW